jgi:hypothetical protein
MAGYNTSVSVLLQHNATAALAACACGLTAAGTMQKRIEEGFRGIFDSKGVRNSALSREARLGTKSRVSGHPLAPQSHNTSGRTLFSFP